MNYRVLTVVLVVAVALLVSLLWFLTRGQETDPSTPDLETQNAVSNISASQVASIELVVLEQFPKDDAFGPFFVQGLRATGVRVPQ